ncbi:MAG: hypothetical protein A2751_01385 [Candidatus Doudnabacteria bacterium RIFCSPHIGHO2_01_FULL_46_14]|uniref:Uncharacterized protein n=1 Tax=Candidatus Doudnabacteria bacterium RIFCSPHIGHO2_01_FULL_46_14 TaxID=1817824 RepID=A0A1F5NMB9_9BACT|nr:MAG: hypothetical protein A2751_01385 [Candidatus Doudnabacteria bacterium RIFCSPHIGHO2_01_FULL_46_14]
MRPKYTRLCIVKASLVLDEDAEIVSPTQGRECDVCIERGRSGTMVLYRNRNMRFNEHTHRSAWKCETCDFAYPGPWGVKGPLKIRLVRGRIAHEKYEAARKWSFDSVVVKPFFRCLNFVFGRFFAAGRP